MKSVTVKQGEFYSWTLIEDSEEEYEEAYEEEIEEAEVDFREELMSAIEVIRREKKKNKKLQARTR
jgi:hypothetical protein